jgi:2-polyprenyl-3-methyl-5-hydroxy-6-metoxy-1,4-benzoquinol methylase
MTITEDEFLQIELGHGISADNPSFVRLCEAAANELKAYGDDIKTVLDYGAGTGVYSDALHRAGYDVKVYEIFNSHRKYINEKYPHLNIIDKPVTTDCLLWIEVSEHMTDKELDNLFNMIKPKYIYHSSTSETTENDIMWGHINIKQQDEWVKLFESKNYRLIKETHIPIAWAKIYKRND